MERPLNLLLKLHSPGNARGASSAAAAQKLVLPHEDCSAEAGCLRGDTPDNKENTAKTSLSELNQNPSLHLEEVFWV